MEIDVNLVKVQVRNLLPQNAKTALYRVTQEALTNIERHANATTVDIRFSMKPDWFEVQIKDNGVGFNVDDKRFNKQTNVCLLYTSPSPRDRG